MNVDFLLPNYSGNVVGSTLVYYYLAAELAAAGHAVDLWHPALDQERRNLSTNLRAMAWAAVRGLLDNPVPWHKFPQGVRPRFCAGLDGLRLKGDLVVGFSWRALEAMASIHSAAPKFGYIVEYETWIDASPERRARMERAYLSGPALLCSSHAVQEMLEGLGCRDVRSCTHGIDRDTYRVLPPAASRHPFRVGCPVRMEAVKSPEVLQKTLRTLRERHGRNMSLWGFGGRGAPASLVELFDDLHPSPSSSELARLYNDSTVFLLPSRLEGFGMPAAEAMSCGVPTIVADNGGIHTFGKHGENCWIVPRDSSEALVEAVERLVSDPDLRQKLSNAAPASLEFLGWAKAGERFRAALSLA